MRCCSIKLANRSELQQFSLKRSERCCIISKIEDGDSSSRFSFSESSKSETPTSREPPRLAVLNIAIPGDMKAFNTGSSIERWTNKRPRLKSAKTSSKNEPNLISPNSDHLDVPNLVKILQNNGQEDPDTQMQQIDPDIQRLLEATHVKESQEQETQAKRKTKRKYKKKLKELEVEENSKSKNKLTKTVSFSLSKPPTPQTEQVIRVDIISNHSIELDEEPKGELSPKPDLVIKTNEFDVASSSENENLIFKLLVPSREKAKDNLVVESKRVVLCQRERIE